MPEENTFWVQYLNHVPSSDQLDRFLAKMEHHLHQEGTSVVIHDATDVDYYLAAPLRKRIALWINKNREEIRAKSPLHLFVMPNTLTQLMVKGIFLIAKPPVPYKVVSSRKTAFAIARIYQETHPAPVALAA